MSSYPFYPNLPEQQLDFQSQVQVFLTRYQSCARQESNNTLLFNLTLSSNSVLPLRITLPLGFPRLAPIVTAQRAIAHPLVDAGMNITMPWGQGSTISQLVYSIHEAFQRAPPQLLDMDTLSRPGVLVDFSQKLKEMSLERLQSLTEEDVTAYALTIPQLTLLCSNRNMLLKECAEIANVNLQIRDRIIAERKAVLIEAELIERKTSEFNENMATLRSLTGTRSNSLSEIEAEMKSLTERQAYLLSDLRADQSHDHVLAFLQLRARFRELEVLKNLLRA